MRGVRRAGQSHPAEQASLFDYRPAPNPPAQRHSSTSLAAARGVASKAATLREKLLAYLRGRGALGATDEEAQKALGMPANTERPRRRELEQMGLVRDSGSTRPTASGRAAVVWVAVRAA